MGLGQTMLTTAFLVLLTFAVVNTNRMMVERVKNYYELEAIKQASYYANSLLDEISLKRFDHTAPGPWYLVPNEFSSAEAWPWIDSEWGPSPTAKYNVNPNGNADTYPYKSIRASSSNWFDDVDDYDGYLREVNTGYLKGFVLKSFVRYTTDPLDSTLQYLAYVPPQYNKKAYVLVWNTNNYFSDTLMFLGETIPYIY